MIHVIDLKFQGFCHAIAAFLIDTEDGLVLVETGPHSTLKNLQQGIRQNGFREQDIRHVLLSHIHLDHAGAAWHFAHLGATIYVHPLGLPHLMAPERLMSSATRIYGDNMDRLWGKMKPIDPGRLIAVPHQQSLQLGQYRFEAFHTPGHAVHHIAWKFQDVLFTGDAAGVKIQNGPVVPPCPPPDINIEDWKASIQFIRKMPLKALYLTHFGIIEHISSHLDQLEIRLQDWAQWIKEQYQNDLPAAAMKAAFQARVARQLRDAGVEDGEIDTYEAANPSWMSVDGLIRYWQKNI